MNSLPWTRDELSEKALRYVWPNFAQGVEIRKKRPKIIAGGKGSKYIDIDGREYIDGFSAMQTCFIGHGRKEIAEAVYKQILEVEFVPTVIDFYSVPTILLAEKLGKLAPGKLERSFFVNDGSEAVETALKMAKQYWWEKGYRRRYKVIARRWGYHGVTMGALSVTGHPYFRPPFEPLVPGVRHVAPPICYRCEFGRSYPGCDLECAKEIEQVVKWENPETIACIIAEPVMGAATGYAVPTKEYIPFLRELCNRYGILLILDEVLAGFGRTGKWFVCQHWDIEPDIVTIAKGVASGYLPIGVAIATQEVASPFMGDNSYTDFRHGHTFGGHSAVCAAALASIEIMEKEDLVNRAVQMGDYLRGKLESLYDFKTVGDIRGIGMLFGIELVADKKTKAYLPKEAEVGRWVRNRCYELGLICWADADIIILAPPLTLTQGEADEIVRILTQAIGEAETTFNL